MSINSQILRQLHVYIILPIFRPVESIDDKQSGNKYNLEHIF